MRAVLRDMPSIRPTTGFGAPDWARALFFASALSGDEHPWSTATVLTVCTGALTDPSATPTDREAAAIILERSGNLPTIDLALDRNYLASRDYQYISGPFALDIARRRRELSVDLSHDVSIRTNSFQRKFWSLATSSSWLSVSAPTAAGKSRIVQQWVRRLATEQSDFNVAYLVPTRALVEEVHRDLTDLLDGSADVFTLPWDSDILGSSRRVYVMTQERLHVVLESDPDLSFNLLFVDEAQKIGDAARGILLQQVIEEIVSRNALAQVIFASPHSANPEVLLDLAPEGVSKSVLSSTDVTVAQNLIHVNPVFRKPREWNVDVVTNGELQRLGTLALSVAPDTANSALAALAITMGDDANARGGNVIYANTPSDAEKIATLISGSTFSIPTGDSFVRLAELQELVAATIHPHYSLISALGAGVAFHYGNMPMLVKLTIEELFRDGLIRNLVCTSTLLEGVNLPCRNIFALNPQKGTGKPMKLADFWNLAGRAGRWGKEFQGNVVCLKTEQPSLWNEVPVTRTKMPIEASLSTTLADHDTLRELVSTQNWRDRTLDDAPYEAVFSYLAGRSLAGEEMRDPWGERTRIDGTLSAAILDSTRELDLPSDIARKHLGISPVLMNRALSRLRASSDLLSMALPFPHESEAIGAYKNALEFVTSSLASGFGGDSRQWQLTFLSVNWMRGYPLARLIDERADWLAKNDPKPPSLASTIRAVMGDVEQYVRFRVPKYLSCYNDLVHLAALERNIDLGESPDVAMMLELGVNTETKASLMSLGLSRAATLKLAELILVDNFSPRQASIFLERIDELAIDVPTLIRREITDLKGRIVPPSE